MHRTFGAPKPLPGQHGYNVRESDRLATESRQMEARLRQLQEQITAEKSRGAALAAGERALMSATGPPGGAEGGMADAEVSGARYGARWRGGRSQRSLRGYSREMQGANGANSARSANSTRSASSARSSGNASSSAVRRQGPKGRRRQPPQKTLAHSQSDSASLGVAGDAPRPSRPSHPARASADGAARPAEPSSPCRQPPAELRATAVGLWTVEQTVLWLRYLNLGTYEDSFREHLISGDVLLDIGLADLDYVGVRALAHRKILLKAIERLRHNGAVGDADAEAATTRPASASQRSRPQQAARPPQSAGGARGRAGSQPKPAAAEPEAGLFVASKAVARAGGEAVARRPQAKVHWSHSEPLSAGDGGAPPSTTDGLLDEEAERAAFRAAVEEWRRGGAPAAADADPQVAPRSAADCSEAQHSGGGVKIVRSAKGLASVSAGAFNFGDAASEAFGEDALGGIAGSWPGIAGGELDEEEEHRMFVKAVEAWRNAGTSSADASAGGGDGERATKAAEALRRQLDDRFQVDRDGIQRQKAVAADEMRRLEEELTDIRRRASARRAGDGGGREAAARGDEDCLEPAGEAGCGEDREEDPLAMSTSTVSIQVVETLPRARMDRAPSYIVDEVED